MGGLCRSFRGLQCLSCIQWSFMHFSTVDMLVINLLSLISKPTPLYPFFSMMGLGQRLWKPHPPLPNNWGWKPGGKRRDFVLLMPLSHASLPWQVHLFPVAAVDSNLHSSYGPWTSLTFISSEVIAPASMAPSPNRAVVCPWRSDFQFCRILCSSF